MAERLDVLKTYKLLIDGQFVRSESGRSISVETARGNVLGHICHASRKDLREAAEAAHRALPKWSGMTAYNRGQILYRMAEMLQSRRDEFIELLRAAPPTKMGTKRRGSAAPPPASARKELELCVDRLVAFAGWADKFAHVLGCNNSVAGPYYNFTIPEPTGIVGIIAPPEPALLGLVSLMAPPLCAGNTIVAMTSDAQPLPGLVFAEVCATADVPAGVINILSSAPGELVKPLAEHREVNAIAAANVPDEHARALKLGSAENLKRVHIANLKRNDWSDEDALHSPWTIEPFVEMKTIWHPSAP